MEAKDRITVGWLGLGGLAVIGGIVLALQRQATGQLRHERAIVQEENRSAARRRAESGSATAQGLATELSALRADRAALARLRAEIDLLKARVQQGQPPSAAETGAVASPPARLQLLPASEWKNAGRGTPTAAVETVLWAAVGGDIDVLADAISLDAGARAKAEMLLAGLPPAARAHYASPEKLVALFTAKDVPVGASMRVVARPSAPADDAKVTLVLQGETATRAIELTLRQRDGNWRLVVPESAVEKYGEALKGEPAIAGGAR